MTTKPEKRRRSLQFSLKSLLLVFLVVASFLAGRVSVTRKFEKMRVEAERQRAVAEMNQKRALEATYRYQIQLAEKALAAPASDAVRQLLLQRTREQYEDVLRDGGGNDRQCQ